MLNPDAGHPGGEAHGVLHPGQGSVVVSLFLNGDCRFHDSVKLAPEVLHF